MADVRRRLGDLLARERKALLTGQLRHLESIAGEKARMLNELGGMNTLRKDDVQSLRAKAQQNQLLYTAALAGLRSAAARIQAIRETEGGFSVYAPDGQSTTLKNLIRSRSQTV